MKFSNFTDQIRAIETPAEYIVNCATRLSESHGIDVDDCPKLLDSYFARCSAALASFNFQDLPAAVTQFDQRLVGFAMGARPDPHQAQAEAAALYGRGEALGWLSEEVDAAVVAAKPVKIVGLEYDRVLTADNRTIMRSAIRERLRTSAFSDSGWRRYLGGLPKIEAPKDHFESD